MAQNEKQNETESLVILQLLHIRTTVVFCIFQINSKNWFPLKKQPNMLAVSAYLQIIPPKTGDDGKDSDTLRKLYITLH